MQIEFLPLLAVQRDLFDQTPGRVRFTSYLKMMIGSDGALQLPIAAFNPMSKPHVARVLDLLLEMDAESVARDAMRDSVLRLSEVAELRKMPLYRFGLVVADDLHGGWTNRYLFEAKDRFENLYAVTHGWIAALMWSGDEASVSRVREETAAAIFRTAWIWKFGLPRTLRAMMRQEGFAARFAGVQAERVGEDVIATLDANMESISYPRLMACLYGDDAAESVGYERIGITARGGMLHASSDGFLGREEAVEALRGSY